MSFYSYAVATEYLLALITFLLLLFIVAPYGRHERRGWGPTVPARLGWFVMETPAALFTAIIFFLGPNQSEAMPLALLAMWEFHYIQRAWIYPWRMREDQKRMPALLMALAIVFNTLNAVVNAGWLSTFGTYTLAWFYDPRFIAGAAMFFAGFAINAKADALLFGLRAPGEKGYKIPRGWLYDSISCPNYFGEILEWFGWALATWSVAGLAFAVYTTANLAPRAFANHRWYKEKFPDYPRERKALIPGVV